MSLICFLNILVWPTNKYEWMLHDDPDMTLPVDNESAFYSIMALVPILFLFFFGIFAKTKKQKHMNILVVMTLLVIWLYKYRVSFF